MGDKIFARELNGFEIVYYAIRLFLRNFEKLAVIVMLILFPIRLFVGNILAPSFSDFKFALHYYFGEDIVYSGMVYFLNTMQAVVVLLLFVTPVLLVATAMIIYGDVQEDVACISFSLLMGIGSYIKLLGTSILYILAVAICCLIPIVGIFIGGYFALSHIHYALGIVFWGESGKTVLKRCARMNREQVGKTFGMVLLFLIMKGTTLTFGVVFCRYFDSMLLRIFWIFAYMMFDAFFMVIISVQFLNLNRMNFFEAEEQSAEEPMQEYGAFDYIK